MNFHIESTNITPETLQMAVEQFLREEAPRRSRLADYYRGRQGVRTGPSPRGVPTTS